jgi:hypothetical protein
MNYYQQVIEVYICLSKRIIPLQQPLYNYDFAILVGIMWVEIERNFKE